MLAVLPINLPLRENTKDVVVVRVVIVVNRKAALGAVVVFAFLVLFP